MAVFYPTALYPVKSNKENTSECQTTYLNSDKKSLKKQKQQQNHVQSMFKSVQAMNLHLKKHKHSVYTHTHPHSVYTHTHTHSDRNLSIRVSKPNMKSYLRRTQRKPLLYPFYCKLKFCCFFRLILRETSGVRSAL